MTQVLQRPAAVLMKTNAAGRLLETGFSANALRPHRGIDHVANALLRKDDWEQLDEAVVRESRGPATGIQDLRDRELTLDLGGLGVLISQWETLSEMSGAEQSMKAAASGEKDRGRYELNAVPVPITFKDFDVDIRHAQARQNGPGPDLDTTYAELATRQVVEKLEDTLFNGGDVVLNGSDIPGYTTHPNRNPVTLTTRWPDLTNHEDAISDAIAMKQALVDDDFRDRFILYVTPDWEAFLDEDYNANKGTETVRERLERISGVEEVKTTLALSGRDEAVMVHMASSVVDLASGAQIMPVQWEVMGGLGSEFKVMAAEAPRVKATQSGKSGIAHLS